MSSWSASGLRNLATGEPVGSLARTVGSHLPYYRVTGVDVIDVVRILHNRMDVDRYLD